MKSASFICGQKNLVLNPFCATQNCGNSEHNSWHHHFRTLVVKSKVSLHLLLPRENLPPTQKALLLTKILSLTTSKPTLLTEANNQIRLLSKHSLFYVCQRKRHGWYRDQLLFGFRIHLVDPPQLKLSLACWKEKPVYRFFNT